MKTLGLFLGSTEDSYGQNILRGIQSVLEPAGVRLVCYTSGSLRSHHGYEAERNFLYDMVDTAGIDGLIVTGAISHHIAEHELGSFFARYSTIPIVTLEVDVPGYPVVRVDNRSGMTMLMRHLLEEHSFERFLYIGGPQGQQEAELRRTIFLQSLAGAGVSTDSRRMVDADFTLHSGYLAARALIPEILPGGSCLVCANDSMAVGAMEALAEAGFSVPSDVAVTGFDDTLEGRFLVPPLTTVRQSTIVLAAEAAQLLLTLLIDPSARVHRDDVPASLVVRSSCGCEATTSAIDEDVDIQTDVRIRVAMERKLNQLRLFSEALITSIRMEDVFHVLEKEFPLLGVSSCAISLFPQHISHGQKTSSKVRLVYRHSGSGRQKIPASTKGFPASQLIPGGISSLNDEDQLVIIEALYSKQSPMGIAMFVCDRYASALTGTLRSLLSGALQSVMLLEERREYEKRLLDYQKELEDSNRRLVTTLATLQEARDKLAGARQMASLGELVASVTHDLRTPLSTAITAITNLDSRRNSFLESLESGSLKRSDLSGHLTLEQETAAIILSNLERAAELLNSFRTMAADQTGDLQRSIQLRAYVDSVVNALKPQWKRRDVRLQVTGGENILIETRPGALSQILSNLIVNSLEHAFTRAGEGRHETGESGEIGESDEQTALHPEININISSRGTAAILLYSDNGPGISPANAEQIFEPFFSTRIEQGGTGLGLNIARNLAETVLQGSLVLQNPGEPGAVFRLELPLVPGFKGGE